MNTGSDIKEVPTTQEGETPSSVGNNLHRGSKGLRLKQSCCFGLAGGGEHGEGRQRTQRRDKLRGKGKTERKQVTRTWLG